MKSELVFIPFPGMGHFISAVEMAKLLVEQENGLAISVIILPSFPGGEDASSVYAAALSAESTDNLRYEVISGGESKPTQEPTTPELHIENQIPEVRRAVAKLVDNNSRRLAGLVVDMFCTPMTDVANEFGVPSYLFYTSTAVFLGLVLHIQRLYDEKRYDVSDSEAELDVPCLTRPYPVKCLPIGLASEQWVTMFVYQGRRFREMKGILVNTVAELEAYALESFCSNEADTPPVYPVGPLLHLENQVGDSKDEKRSEILRWLDEQPARSVVFLCFGSLGSFSEEQAREMAVALERSGHRFLWSLRRRASPDMEPPREFTNLNEVLPEGFLDRTKENGKVIGRAPQVAVLENPAIGGFVTHCGWNSTLESLWFGVPMLAWPLYAEQKLNAFELVEELGLAVEIKRYWRGNIMAGVPEILVTAEEIERGIRCVMEQDSNVRNRVKEMSENCRAALMDGGSSRIALQKFIQDVKKNLQ